MIPQYVPILRAKKGEFNAIRNLSESSHERILPLFEFPRFTNKTNNLVICRGQPNPIECYLNDLVNKIITSRGTNPVLIDIFKWSPDSTVENGEHVLSYIAKRLSEQHTPVIPVIGYDRWEDEEYSNALSLIDYTGGKYCLRLESYAFSDMLDDDYFLENIDDIIAKLNLDTSKCSVILDFGDVTKVSISEIQDKIATALSLLSRYQFEFISIAGCSLTTVINDMVSDIDSTGTIIRREMIAWEAYKRHEYTPNLIFGDYGVVNPTAQDDIIAPDANGKIRYTIKNNYFVVRGHSRRQGNKGEQMYDLSQIVADSSHYMLEIFSWGDKRIKDCSNRLFKGSPCDWVAIDTNHHIQSVITEIFEFESSISRRLKRELA